MKKTFCILATALALVACSNDEVIETIDNQAEIGFESFVGKATRATDATAANLSWFKVFGYMKDKTTNTENTTIFDGTLVSKSGGAWSYSPTQYWVANKDYFFTAAGSQAEEANCGFIAQGPTAFDDNTTDYKGNATITFNNGTTAVDELGGAAGQSDLVYAFATKSTDATKITADPGKVQFAFKHALSRVKVTFTNKMGSDIYTIKITNLKIKNAYQSAKFDVKTAAWSEQTTAVELGFDNAGFSTEGKAANNNSTASSTLFLIPATIAYNISYDVELLQGTTSIATYSHTTDALASTEYKAGYSYNFVAELTPANIDPANAMFPIEFTCASVDEWTNADDMNVTH